MQLEILSFFQHIHSGTLDAIMNLISMFGEIAVPLIVLCLTYWCISKRKGFMILSSLMAALLATQVVKAIVRAPRPFQAHPELIEGGRIETATGYSFPSGHSATGSSFYSSLAYVFRKGWIIAAAVILIIAIPVSRMYLGVHWPIDVTVGTIIGLASGILLCPLFGRIFDDDKAFCRFTAISGTATALVSIILTILLTLQAIDEVAFSDFMSNAAVASGALLGAFIERRTIDYRAEAGSIGQKCARFAAGIATIAITAIAIRAIPLPYYVSHLLLFFAIGMMATYVYPRIAVALKLADR